MGLDEYFKDGKLPVNADDELQKMYSYLSATRRAPQLYVEDKLRGTNVNGQYLPERNEIALNPNAQSVERTVPHEMYHGVYEQMVRQYWATANRPDKTKEDRQFLDTYNKVMKSPNFKTDGVNPQTNQTYIDDSDRNYRTGSNERLAFGVGNSQRGNSEIGFPMPPHYDASNASAAMVLLDQAHRAAQSVRTTPPTLTNLLMNMFKK